VDRVVDTTGAGDAFLGGIIAGDVIFNDIIMKERASRHSNIILPHLFVALLQCVHACDGL